MTQPTPLRRIPEPAAPGPDLSLPAWVYHDPAFFELEREKVFRTAWQLVCHLNDVPQAGDYQTFDFLGEHIVVLRGADGQVGAFHNVCRHRGAMLLTESGGNCGHRLVCPYHAWSYGLDGRLANVPRWQGFTGLDHAQLGLKPVEMEVWRGFIFVRLAPGLPSVAEMMAPYAEETEPYDFEALVPLGRVTLRPREVNWKNVSDNYSDGLHIPVAHPGLTRLFGPTYAVEAREWVDKMWGVLQERPSASVSERMYQALAPRAERLPEDRRRLWAYYKLWPNTAFDVYPDSVDFMQFVPVSATKTVIREIAYAWPDERREMKAMRYLNWRINRQVNAEDTTLIERVQKGMTSSSFTTGPLSPAEVCLISFGERLRALIPEAALERAP